MPNHTSNPDRLRQLITIAWERPILTTITLLTAVLATLFELALPLLTGGAIDIALGQTGDNPTTSLLERFTPSGTSMITAVIVLIVLVALARYATQFGRRYTAGKLSIGVQHDIRLKVLESLQRLDGPGQDEIRTGQVVSRSISDINQVQGLLAMMPMIVGNMVKLVVTLVIMVLISPPLTIIALILVPLLLFTVAYSRRALFASTWSAQQKAADLATHVEETVSGIRVVKAFVQEDREVERVEDNARDLYSQRMRTARLTARFIPMVEQLPQIALVVNIVGGGYLAMTGQITVGTFVAFSAYLTSLSAVARSLSGMLMRIQLALSSVERVFEVIDLTPQHNDPVNPESLPTGQPLGLRFNNVQFRGILNGLDLTIRPGETSVIVGPPGAGKTMAVQLAGNFYQPDDGSIDFLDANREPIPFDRLTSTEIRRNLIAVFDEPFLYSTTIRDNIAMGLDVTDEQVRHAAEMAQAHEFVEKLTNGYQEVVGERGLTLSGGQRQRIALARAFLARPRVLVLDDATSAIDATTEDRIFRAIREELDDVTILMIAHRHSSLELADRVGLVEKGRLTAYAPLEEMNHNPRFAHLMAIEFKEAGDPEFTLDGTDEPSHEELWPPQPEQTQHYRIITSASSGQPGPGGRGGGRGASMAATPELIAQVEALPPATEQPLVDTARLKNEHRPFELRRLFRQVRFLIAAVIALLLVGVVADLAFPTLMRIAIDNGVQARDTNTLWIIAGAGAAVVLTGWAAATVNTVLTARTGERLLFGLRLRSFVHLLRLSMDYFERTMSGRIMTRMTTDIDNLSAFLQTGLAQTVVSVGTLVGVVTMLTITDATLAAAALAVVPVIIVITIIFRRISSRLYTQSREQISQVNATFQESIAGLRTAQMHGMEDRVNADFQVEAEEYRRLRVNSQTAVSIYFPGLSALSEIAQAIVLGLGAWQVARGELSPGVLVAFVLYMGLMFGPIQQLSQIFDSYQQAAVGFRRIRELLATTPSVPDTGTTGGARTAARHELELVDVSFAYTDTPAILEHVHLTIQPGTTIAVVGSTGAGKSTIVKLLSRLYDPTAGEIRAGGTDIRDFPTKDWRRAIGHVPQEAHLFSGTVADNIGYGMGGASTSMIEDAARRVGALTAIAAIPGGFNHPVGERGRGLSSGQRQLIALARAELIEPEIMLLDEATSTLDPATETVILNAADRVTRNRTSVIVAHRLATASRADRILVVDGGRIIEDGSHDELLGANGTYASMWHLVR